MAKHYNSKIKTLYLVKCEGQDIYKIGITQRFKERMYAIQTNCPYKVKVIHSVDIFEIEPKEGLKVEKELNEWLKAFDDISSAPGYKAMNGEWFEQLDIKAIDRLITLMDSRKHIQDCIDYSPTGRGGRVGMERKRGRVI